MIRHLALAILMALVAASPAAADPARIGSFATGPTGWHSVTSPPTTGTGTQHEIYPIQNRQFPTVSTPPNLHLTGCAFCTGHDGGVGVPSN
jgi:hypothetical protein